ncbi:hypothetical protein ACKWTF_004518 [Chironomus riparius]
MKRFLILVLFLKCVNLQQPIFNPVNTAEISQAARYFQSQLPILQASIPLTKRLAGNSDPNNCFPFCNLPNFGGVSDDLARLQTIKPEDIRAYQERERNPPTTSASFIIQPNIPATRRPSFKYPEIKNSLNGPNYLLKNVGGPYGGGLGIEYAYGK